MIKGSTMDEEKALISEFYEQREKAKYELKKLRLNKLFYHSFLIYVITVTGFLTYVYIHRLHSDNDNDVVFSKEYVFEKYLEAMETNLASNWSKIYTSESHLAGTNYNMVEWASNQFEEFGLDVEIDEYEVYLSYPVDHSLKLISSETGELIYEAPLVEDIIDEDETTYGKDSIPTFLGYAGNGNITSEFIYCNYGSVEDFAKLKELGIDIKDKIAIVRYGKIFRGLKVKFAQDEGASGVLIYNDPADDFGLTEFDDGIKTYPKGPGRQPSSVQRGSVQFLSVIPGDPTTPGYGSKKGVKREDPFISTPKIPVLPISYKEIKPILSKLNGYGLDIGKEFKGTLPKIDYSTGPNSKYELQMYSEQIFNITPIWNIYAKIEGENSNEVIIIGNHHDSWIKGGAGDPNSGSSVLMELARGLGILKKLGWKPKRTIMLCSWDGEEYGLIGSTEFGETMSNFIDEKVIAYLNLDVACVGNLLNLHSSPLLFDLLRSIAKLIEHPDDGINLYEHFVNRSNDNIINLGSGSDYTVFLDHLGIPSLDLSFVRDKSSPIYHYHSNYDSYHWMSKFGDPNFIYHNVMAKYLGLLVLELSETKLIRFKTFDSATALFGYFQDSISNLPDHWIPLIEDLLNDINNEFNKFDKNSKKFDLDIVNLQLKYDNEYDNLPIWSRLKLKYKIYSKNKILKYFERNYLFEKGLINRSWFKHIVFASGRFTGYAGQTFPGLRESIEDGKIDDCIYWLKIYFNCIKKVNKLVS